MNKHVIKPQQKPSEENLSSWHEALRDPKFREFYKRLIRSPDWDIAIHGHGKDQLHAIHLCIASAWLESKEKEAK